MKHRSRNLLFVLSFMVLGVFECRAQGAADRTANLLVQFENPPQTAHPRVWWHWMNGNISKEGITLDLDWMHRIGIAGFQNFDAALETPQVVEHRLSYMTSEWKDAFKYAVSFGEDLGMEEAIAGSPGWSESGGPWVSDAEAMKKYVWSETVIDGGKPFKGILASPPRNTGAFQNLGIQDIDLGGPKLPVPQFYADSAVVAFRKPTRQSADEATEVKVSCSDGSINPSMLADGDLAKATRLAMPEVGKTAWIEYAFSKSVSVDSVTFAMNVLDRARASAYGIAEPEIVLESSENRNSWHKVTDLRRDSAPETTLSFAPVRARYFRVSFLRPPAQPIPDWAKGLDAETLKKKFGPPPSEYEVAELVMHFDARVNHFEEKAAFVPVSDLYNVSTPHTEKDYVISPTSVIDLTSKMQPDGTLDWTPPAGKWVVLRFGYSLLGITNHPATAEATGLEVDKMDRRFVKKYMETYLDSYKQALGPNLMGKHGLCYVVNDSWEAGAQNWTDNMIVQFRKLRGYDPVPWMPVLAGRVVGSSEASDRFLWDFRKTIADLIASEHYGQLEDTIRAYGMGHYVESHEVAGRALIADGMEVKKYNEVPMSAMWTQMPDVYKEAYGFNADDRESASVAHIYGQNIAAAESMTTCESATAWMWSPATLKATADAEFLNGINRFVIHESAHQPLIGKAPGMTLGPCGQWFNRNETWAEQAKPWIDYLSRTSFLLQQGHFGADLVYFYGEDSNLTAIFADKAPDIPAGYGFDYINADALIHELSVAGGAIITPSGMSYRVLALDPRSRHMSLLVLRAIHKLVTDGAVVSGPKPIDDPSLADNQDEFARLSRELFGDGTGVHHVGKGAVYTSESLSAVVAALHLEPDFDYSKPEPAARLEFVHRKLAEGDAYFIANRGDRAEKVNATFRVSGREAELWHPDTGVAESASFSITNGRTTVPLSLEPWGSVFVVFRKPTQETKRTLPVPIEKPLITIDGLWAVNFQAGRGAPESITLDKLSSWNESADVGVKYFSGTATYAKTVNAPEAWFGKGAHLWIDLGTVYNLATVSINGQQLGQVWHAPFRLDATSALHPGENAILISVTNSWVNRLIGDEQPNAVKVTFADEKPYHADSKLQPSGMLGPVMLVESR